MSIVTDSTPVEAPKNPDTCNVFQIYKHVATESEQQALRNNYLKGGLGYGKAKEILFEALLTHFQKERSKFYIARLKKDFLTFRFCP